MLRSTAPRAASPSAATLHPHPIVLARTTGRLLDACAGAAGSAGLLCTAGAMVALVMRAPLPLPVAAACAVVLLLFPLERLLWLRVRFDAGLFTDLALGPDGTDAAPPSGATSGATSCATFGASLDAALHALRLRGPGGAPRPLVDRAQGARRLAQRHGLVALAQFALFMSALALGRCL